jgi:hypothetical protein
MVGLLVVQLHGGTDELATIFARVPAQLSR